MKNQASPDSCLKNPKTDSLSVCWVSVSFLEYHHQVDAAWCNLPPWAMLGSELKLQTIKRPKIVPQHQLGCLPCPSPVRRTMALWWPYDGIQVLLLWECSAVAAQAHPAPSLPSLGTDGLAKLWREAARDSRGSQQELDEGQGEFPLQHAIPRYGAS